jgi:hypothetical protein
MTDESFDRTTNEENWLGSILPHFDGDRSGYLCQFDGSCDVIYKTNSLALVSIYVFSIAVAAMDQIAFLAKIGMNRNWFNFHIVDALNIDFSDQCAKLCS